MVDDVSALATPVDLATGNVRSVAARRAPARLQAQELLVSRCSVVVLSLEREGSARGVYDQTSSSICLAVRFDAGLRAPDACHGVRW